MVSFSFDDAPVSAALAGAQILERRGLKGTYYIASGMLDGDSPSGRILSKDQLRALEQAGHEIACHTFSHLDCGAAPAARIEADVERNLAAFAELGLPRPTTFAYPYGEVSAAAKRALGRRFALSRSVRRDVIGAGADLNQAPAVGIEGADGEDLARRWMDQAKARKAWVILFTHDVADEASPWGCTPATLAHLADKALAEDFEVVTVQEGCRLIGAL